MATVSGITIYPMSSRTEGRRVESLDELIEPTKLAGADTWDATGTDDGGNPWSARLYLWTGAPRPPAWLAFLQDGFGADDRPVELPDGARSSAVIAVRIVWRRTDRFYAVPFGDGRHRLRRSLIDAELAKRALLNAIYTDDRGDAALEPEPRIRQIEYVARDQTTFRTVRQASRSADFDAFGFDAELEQLAGLTGRPGDVEALGLRVSGKTSVRLSRRVAFDELARLCRSIAGYTERRTYQRRFGFIDRVQRVTGPLATTLAEAMYDRVAEEPSAWSIDLPDVVDYDTLATFSLVTPDGEELARRDELEVADVVADLGASGGELASVALGTTVVAWDADGERAGSWPLPETLSGQLVHEDATYLRADGAFSEVAPDYLAAVDAEVDTIAPSSVVLPDSRIVGGREIDEGTYNELAAASSPDHLLLDKRTAVVPGRTTPVEVCDILTSSGQLIHVKRKFSSSSLSHLFGQGVVSGDALASYGEFRSAVRDLVADSPLHAELFAEPFLASAHEVVYAIVGPWREGEPLSAHVPFFSRVNLRRHAATLRRLGYRVTYARITPQRRPRSDGR